MTSPTFDSTARLDNTLFRRAIGQMRSDLNNIVAYAKRNGTLTLTAKLSGTSLAAAKAQIDAAVGGRTLPFKITLDPQSIRTAVSLLRSALGGVVSINTASLLAVQTQVNGQIAQLNALIAQLRALGGGSGGGGGGSRGGSALSAATQALLRDLEKLNNEYRRGDIDSNQYAARLAGLQSALRVAAATATAGTAEFKALDRAVTATVQGMRSIETNRITSLKTELAGARAQFDAAAAAATSLAQRRAAIAAYEGDLGRIRVALQGMATSGRLTEQQLGAVNRMLAQTARESQTIKGKINIGGLSGNIGNALQQLSGYVPGMTQLSGVLNSLPPGLLAAAAGAGALAAGLASSFKTAAEFQQRMADINALTRPTSQAFQQLSDTAINFGIPLGVGGRAAAAGILELNKAGLSAQQVLAGGLPAALNLSAAAAINTAEAAKLTVTAMTAFKLSASDLPKIADIFTGFANQTVLGAEDLGLAMAAVGPVATASGLKLNDFAGYMATLAQGGFRSMADAGTSLKTVLLNLKAPAGTAAKAMADIGLNTYDAKGNLLPFETSLENLRKSLAGLSAQQRNNVLRDIFGQDGIRAAEILLSQTQKAIQGNIDAIEKQGDAAGTAKSRLNSYQGAVSILTAKFEAFRIEVGEKLLPAATGFVKFLGRGVDGLRAMTNSTETLIGYLAPLLAGILVLTGPAVVTGLGAVATAIGACAAASAAWVAANPWGAAALAISALLVKVNQLYAEIKQIYDETDRRENESFEKTMAKVRELRAAGGEANNTQAALLVAQQRLSQAQEGRITGTTAFGERIVTVDPAEVQAAQKRVQELREELAKLRTEAGRRGAAGAKSTNDATGLDPALVARQSQAITLLREQLAQRLDASDSGVPPRLGAKILEIQRAYKKLGADLKEAFGGNLNNQEYLKGAAELQAAQAQEIARVRAASTAAAAAGARDSALKVQKAELDAMKDGAQKRAAQRELEIEEITRQAQEEAKKYADAPKVQAQIEEDGRRVIAAKRRGWATEDQQLAQESADRVAEAQRAAEGAQVAAMEEGRAKREAVRDQELEDLRQTIAERVKALAGDPEAQASVQASGNSEIASKVREQAQQRVAEEKTAQQQVTEARRAARDAEIAAIADEGQRRAAERQRDLEGVQESVRDRVQALEGYPEMQAAVIADGERQVRAIREKAAQDDEKDARDRARRIADAWITAQTAQAEAQAAGREAESAAFELRLSRQLAQVKDNAVAVAQLEAGAVADRARLAAQAAQAQYTQDQRQLEVARDKALGDDQLSASERQAIWSTYYSNLGKLSATFQAGERERLQQREEADRQAAENLRLARITAADQPIERSAGRVQELEASRALARTDAEVLRINQGVEAERQKQLAGLRGQLLGLGGVILTTQERAEVETRIRGIQLDQRKALLDQKDAAQALRDSTLARLDAEAQYAERVARTDAERVAAQQRQIVAYQRRLGELDTQIAGEGREQERNTLLNQRLDLMGKIQDVQEKIDTAPLTAQQRQVAALQAQRGYALELAGLSEDAVARAREGVRAAEDEVTLARQAVELAKTKSQADQETAQTDLTNKQTALLVAQRELSKSQSEAAQKRSEEEGKALDLAEARLRAEAQLRGLADDAVASAELDLDITRRRLALVTSQASGATGEAATTLERERLSLVGQQAEQERKLAQAQRDRGTILQGLADAQAQLTREMDGSYRTATPLQQAYQGIADARKALARAEADYQRAQAEGKPEQVKTATEALTSAIKGQRDAVSTLAEKWKALLGSMDGVRTAAKDLGEVVNGGQPGPFNSNREIDRFYAIEKRRNAAIKDLQEALASGDQEAIAAATRNLADQEKRYRDQAALLKKNGISVALSNEKQVEDLAGQVDLLGIENDKEAQRIQARQKIAEKEAASAQVYSAAADRLGEYGLALAGRIEQLNRGVQDDGVRYSHDGRSFRTLAEVDEYVLNKNKPQAAPTPQLTAQAFAAELLQALRAAPVQAPIRLPAVAATAPVTNISNVTDVGGLTIYQQPGENAEALADRVIGKLEDRARRSGRKC